MLWRDLEMSATGDTYLLGGLDVDGGGCGFVLPDNCMVRSSISWLIRREEAGGRCHLVWDFLESGLMKPCAISRRHSEYQVPLSPCANWTGTSYLSTYGMWNHDAVDRSN